MKENLDEFIDKFCNSIDARINEQKYRAALKEIRYIAKDIYENDVYENSDAKAVQIMDIIDKVLECQHTA